MFVLTGDSSDNAINVAYNCNIIKEIKDIVKINN